MKSKILGVMIAVIACSVLTTVTAEAETTIVPIKQITEERRLNNMLDHSFMMMHGLAFENEELKEQNRQLEEENEQLRKLIEDSLIGTKYLGEFNITYYCCEKYSHICGTGTGKTASGTSVTPGRTIAVDTSVIPYGTKLYIEGVGYRIAEDRGGSVNGNKIDVAVETHDEALALGKKSGVKVWIVNN